jgi:hypothetical protein
MESKQMKPRIAFPLVVATCAMLLLPHRTAAQTAPAIPAAIATPDKVESRLGTLDFKDGAPSKESLAKVYDNLDFTHAFEAFVNTMQGVNAAAGRKGLLDAGVKDNEILVFSTLMDAKSLFLTANADTVYFLGFIDLSKGPMVLETPPKALGTLDDMWWRWVIDFGLPGPDRGEGGKYLILPPDYEGALPEGGYYVARARPTRVLILGRMFLENKSDPKPAGERGLIARLRQRLPTPGPDPFGRHDLYWSAYASVSSGTLRRTAFGLATRPAVDLGCATAGLPGRSANEPSGAKAGLPSRSATQAGSAKAGIDAAPQGFTRGVASLRGRGTGVARRPLPRGVTADPCAGRCGGFGAGDVSEGIPRGRELRTRHQHEGVVVHDSPQYRP